MTPDAVIATRHRGLDAVRALAAGAVALATLATAAVALAASPGASAGASAGPAASAAAAVSIVQKTFQPGQVTVHVGDTVVWTVTEGINEPHTVTSGTPTDATTGTEFDSGLTLKANGDTFSHTFATAGSFSYFCSIHPTTMTGSVVVLAAGETSAPSGAASAAASAAPSVGASAAASPAASAAGSAAPAQPAAAPEPPIDPATKLIAAGILVVALAILFGWGTLYRRMNPPPRT
jgi:plastocyanin